MEEWKNGKMVTKYLSLIPLLRILNYYGIDQLFKNIGSLRSHETTKKNN